MLLRYVGAPLLFTCAVLAAACAKPAVHRLLPWIPFLHRWRLSPVTAMSLPVYGYADGAAVPLLLDEQGNGHYVWKDGRFETHALIGHTWHGMCFRRRMTEMWIYGGVLARFFRREDAGGTAASEPTMHPRKRQNVSSQQEDRAYEPQ